MDDYDYELQTKLIFRPALIKLDIAFSILSSLAVLAGFIMMVVFNESVDLFKLLIGPIMISIGCDLLIFDSVFFRKVYEQLNTFEDTVKRGDYMYDTMLAGALEIISIICILCVIF